MNRDSRGHHIAMSLNHVNAPTDRQATWDLSFLDTSHEVTDGNNLNQTSGDAIHEYENQNMVLSARETLQNTQPVNVTSIQPAIVDNIISDDNYIIKCQNAGRQHMDSLNSLKPLICNSICSKLSGNTIVNPQCSGVINENKMTNEEPELTDGYSRLIEREPSSEIPSSVIAKLAQCGFYFGNMTKEEAEVRLKHSAVGAFLLRDSSDPNFVFALSVKTCRGTTSTRIRYMDSLFQLHYSPEQRQETPAFPCVIQLVEYYVKLTRYDSLEHRCIFVESTGRKDTPVVLMEPLHTTIPSLKHLCRKTINHSLCGNSVDRLYLTPSLKAYLADYPYTI